MTVRLVRQYFLSFFPFKTGLMILLRCFNRVRVSQVCLGVDGVGSGYERTSSVSTERLLLVRTTDLKPSLDDKPLRERGLRP